METLLDLLRLTLERGSRTKQIHYSTSMEREKGVKTVKGEKAGEAEDITTYGLINGLGLRKSDK